MFSVLRLLNPRSNFRSRCLPVCMMTAMDSKGRWQGSGNSLKRQRKAKKTLQEGSSEDVLNTEVQKLIRRHRDGLESPASKTIQADESNKEATDLPERFSEIVVSVTQLSSTGDGLGLSANGEHVFVVPFTVPGDLALAKVVSHRREQSYSITDLLSISKPSPMRDNARIKCQYFGRCGGCQLQMISYEDQLLHKHTIVQRAYDAFSGLVPEQIPKIEETVPSPLQYGYRTKLTPHFDAPPGTPRRGKRGSHERPKFTEAPPIGFNIKNQRKVLDVEDCPIGTSAVRQGLKDERQRVQRELANYHRGATLLVRETTKRVSVEEAKILISDEAAGNEVHEAGGHVETKTYTTDNNGLAKEYIGNFEFENVAGAFFQNNNSILPVVTQYIRDNIIESKAIAKRPDGQSNRPAITNLLDAYCGSGLFTITLSALFQKSIGIDISDSSIKCARKNAELNGVDNARFISATASKIFSGLDIDPNATAVVIDPPRKGCDEDFLNQLLDFGAQRIVYVSCNVHTQARDVGVLVEGRASKAGVRCRYNIESIRGFDFFPQSGHVEGVAILDRAEPA